MWGRTICAVLSGCALALSAETPPAFEVAAIKISDTNSPVGIRRPDLPMYTLDTDTRASIFTAIREQPGLRLTAGRAPVESIAIDHIENHPTDNQPHVSRKTSHELWGGMASRGRLVGNRPCSVVNAAKWPITNRPQIYNPPHLGLPSHILISLRGAAACCPLYCRRNS